MNDDELILRRKRQNADRARAYRKRKKDLDAMPSTSTVQSDEPVSENIVTAKLVHQKQLNAERCRRYRQKCKRLKSGANFNQGTSDSDTSASRDAVFARYIEKIEWRNVNVSRKTNAERCREYRARKRKNCIKVPLLPILCKTKDQGHETLLEKSKFTQIVKSIKKEVDVPANPAEHVEIEILVNIKSENADIKTENAEQEDLEFVKSVYASPIKKEIVDDDCPEIKSPLRCEFCQKSYQTEYGLKAYCLCFHTKGSYRCNECNKEFTCKQYLSVHYSRVHSSETYKCDICNKLFKSKSLLAEHFKFVHRARQHMCNICNKELKNKSSLREHEKRGICFDNMDKITQEQNKIIIREEPDEIVIKEEPDDNQIEIGPIVFQHSDVNYRPYNEEQKSDSYLSNPYKCNLCNKAFNNKQYLSLHNTHVHSGEVFECEVCNKICRSQYMLTEHLKYVHKTSWYKCDLCKKKLKSKSSLRKHLKCGICLSDSAENAVIASTNVNNTRNLDSINLQEHNKVSIKKEPPTNHNQPVAYQHMDYNYVQYKTEVKNETYLSADNLRGAFNTNIQDTNVIVKQEPDDSAHEKVPAVFQGLSYSYNDRLFKKEPEDN